MPLLNQPDRATVLNDLKGLAVELAEAENVVAEELVRRRIDRRLEDLYGCSDPAGIASQAEFGSGATAPT